MSGQVREISPSPESAQAESISNASDPISILQIATDIAHGRIGTPDAAITGNCRAQVEALRDADGLATVAQMEECLMGRDVDTALQWLLEVGAMDALLPELAVTVELKQEAGRQHKDVWEHTKLVVKQSVRRPAVRWAALLHDIGKVPTRRFTDNGVHFHGHAEVGARMFDRIARRLPFDRDLRKTIRFLIKYHLRSAQYEPDWTDSAVRRFHREMEQHLTDLLDLSRADITSRRPGRRRFLLRQISELKQRIDKVVAEDAQVPPLPSGLGGSIMNRFGLSPSRHIGELKQALEAAIARGELTEGQDDGYYLDWLDKSGLVKSPGI